MSNYIYVKHGCTPEEVTYIKQFFKKRGAPNNAYSYDDPEAYYFMNLNDEQRKVYVINGDTPLFPLLKEHGKFYSIDQIYKEVNCYYMDTPVYLFLYNNSIQYSEGWVSDIAQVTCGYHTTYDLTIKTSKHGLVTVRVPDLQKKAYKDEVNKIFIAPSISSLQNITAAFRSSLQATLFDFERL